VRRICSNCKQEQRYTEDELHALGIAVAEAQKVTFYKGAG
jgi:type II secretory ATPase GspE/PulE/Tfp pilus assembly ATPase PilB-like protein